MKKDLAEFPGYQLDLEGYLHRPDGRKESKKVVYMTDRDGKSRKRLLARLMVETFLLEPSSCDSSLREGRIPSRRTKTGVVAKSFVVELKEPDNYSLENLEVSISDRQRKYDSDEDEYEDEKWLPCWKSTSHDISSYGRIRLKEEPEKIWSSSRVYSPDTKKYYSTGYCLLMTFNPLAEEQLYCSTKERRDGYHVAFHDGNKSNLKLENVYWKKFKPEKMERSVTYVNPETGQRQVFKSIAEASRLTGDSCSKIIGHCRGITLTQDWFYTDGCNLARARKNKISRIYLHYNDETKVKTIYHSLTEAVIRTKICKTNLARWSARRQRGWSVHQKSELSEPALETN